MNQRGILAGDTVLEPMEPPAQRLRQAAARDGGEGDKRNRRKTGNRFAVLNTFLDFSAGKLKRAEVLTWLILYRDTKPNGTARTSQSDIARRIGADVRTVRRALARLIKAGLVKIAYQGGFRKGSSAYMVIPLQAKHKVDGSCSFRDKGKR